MQTCLVSEPRSGVVVLPVYNEAPTVERVIEAVRGIFDGPIIVVDDGSDDGTGVLLARRDDIDVVTHATNRGYGASLVDGFAAALATGREAVITMDCDGQHEPAHIPEFLLALDGCEIVSGSRYLPGSRSVGTVPPQRQDVNRRVTELINQTTGWSLTDAFCGFKAYRAEALAQLTFTEPGYAMPLELWARAFQAGLCIVEHPIERIYFDGDRSFGQDLDDPERRLTYYMHVWERSLAEED